MDDRRIKGRIGIFQADWPLQSQTANCASLLAYAGYEVDMFFHRVPQYVDILSLPAFQETSRIHLHILGHQAYDNPPSFPRQRNQKIVPKLKTFVEQYFVWTQQILGKKQPLIAEAVTRQASAIIEGKLFRLFIGVEKKGLIWAGIMGDHFQIPYIYYSLELYTKDHPDAMRTPLDRLLKAAEESYHRKAKATIIQDIERATVLYEDNGLTGKGLTFFIPVSLLDNPQEGKSTFLRDKFNLPSTQKLILQFGLFYDRRFSLELIDIAKKFPMEQTLILHGFSLSKSYHRQIQKKLHHRCILSQELVPSSNIGKVVASADIGLVLYTAETKNDFLTSFSSEKMALYLQHGKPIIAFDYPGYRQLMDECECGVLIHDLSELPSAVNTILENWDHYSKNAFRCFSLHYDFNRNFKPFLDWLHHSFKSPSNPPYGEVSDA